MPCPAMAVSAGMVPSWEGAAGSTGLVANAVAEPITEKEKHNSIASPVVRESSLRMWAYTSGSSIYSKADYILLFKTQPVRDREQLPSFRMCSDLKSYMRILFLLLVICSSSAFAQQLPPAPKA